MSCRSSISVSLYILRGPRSASADRGLGHGRPVRLGSPAASLATVRGPLSKHVHARVAPPIYEIWVRYQPPVRNTEIGRFSQSRLGAQAHEMSSTCHPSSPQRAVEAVRVIPLEASSWNSCASDFRE